jgi:hypothetical protein
MTSKKFKRLVRRKPKFTDAVLPKTRPAVLYQDQPAGLAGPAPSPWARGAQSAAARLVYFEGPGLVALAPAHRKP